MQCKAHLLLILAIFLSGSCTGKKNELTRGDGFAFFKNSESNEACVNANLSQWELSGAFLHRLLTCASNRSSDGGETLPATQKLLGDMTADKIQKLVDFALIPDATAITHEGRYPYLLAIASVLDRGLTEGRKQGLDLTSERLELLQPFLLSLDPTRVQNQLSLWSKSGQMERLLGELGIFLQSLQDDSISAITWEILAGQNFGPRFLIVSQAVLSQTPLMSSLDQALSAKPLAVPDDKARHAMLEDWRQPRSVDAPESLLALASAPESTTTFAHHLHDFSEKLSDDEIQKLSKFAISFWNAYRSMPEKVRESVSYRLVKGLEQSLNHQKNPAQWFLSVAQDLSVMPAADLNSISETLGRLLEPSNDPTLDTLRSKLWSSRMMEQMLELITQGGPVPGCPGMTIKGLKDLPADDFAASYAVLRSLNIPQEACQQKPPLKVALEFWSNVAVGHNCSSENCLELIERPTDPFPSQSYWADAYAEPDTVVLQKLVRSTLIEARRALERDQYFLRNLAIAYRAVSPEFIDGILKKWDANPPSTLRDLVAWEGRLMQDESYHSVLHADPLEKMLSLRLENLGSLSQQFHELVPDNNRDFDKSINQRATRVFAGAYTNGPLEQALRYKLPATLEGPDDILQDSSLGWPEDVKKTFREQRSLLSFFLFRFKNADSIFRNPELGSLTNGSNVPIASLGSPLRYSGYNELGEASIQPRVDNRIIQPSQGIHAWSENDSTAWGLWNQQLTSSSLVSKDLPPREMGSFESFSANFAGLISDEMRWKDLSSKEEPVWSQSAPGINAEFFDVEAYRPEEARMLALYYLRHYHKLPNAFPSEKTLPPVSSGMLRGFFSGSSLISTMDADYTLFAKLFPETLSGTAASLEDLSAQALSSALDGSELFAPTKISPVRGVGQLAGKYPELLTNTNFKLLSSLNILGLTKSGSAYYIQPLIGLDGTSCVSADGEKSSCAIELSKTDQSTGFKQYQTFIANVLAQNFCPLLATDQFGSKDDWRQRLQLTVGQASTCTQLRVNEVPVAEELRFPAWLSKRILTDIFSMGRKAQLKPGLAQVPSALRFYKLMDQKIAAEERAKLWLRQARGNWSALNAASQSRRQFYAVQFWAAQPNLLNAYLDQWEQSIEPISWADFLASLARRGGEGTSQDVVHEFFSMVIETQRESAQAGQSLLEMGFHLMERISARPDLLDAAGHILGNFASSENYDFAGRDLPFAMTLFSNFHWNDAGPRFTKFLAQRETINSWVTLCEYFSPDEFGRLLHQIQQSTSELGTKAERSDLLARFLKENVELGTLVDLAQNQTLSRSWEVILRAWQDTQFGEGFLSQWEAMLSTLDLPLKTLDGRTRYKTSEILELWLPQILRKGMGLLALHQDIGASEETGFWSLMMLDMVHSIQSEPLGARTFARFLADPKLGFIQGGIWIRALNEGTARLKMAEALTSLNSVPEDLWREALVESSEMLGRLSKALGYMKQRMVWKEDPEHNAYRQVIDQLYSLSSETTLRENQVEVLKLWFRDDEPRMAIKADN